MSESILPPGAFYQTDFVSPEEAAILTGQIDSAPWRSDLKRRVQHYGYRYDYKARVARKEDYLGPLPDWTSDVLFRLTASGPFSSQPDQIIVNEYEPGQGIAAHVDCVPCFGATIAMLSLCSGLEMVLTSARTGKVLTIYLEPDSLLVLSAEARYDWSHKIVARKYDIVEGQKVPRSRRLSITFRTMNLTHS